MVGDRLPTVSSSVCVSVVAVVSVAAPVSTTTAPVVGGGYCLGVVVRALIPA